MSNSGKTGALASKYYRAAMQAALSALKHGDTVNAERLALRAASLGPNSEAPWLVLAALAGPQESLAYARKALQINPESIRAQQAVEWAIGRLSTQPSTSEPEHFHPIVGMIESMPEVTSPPVREPAQFPEPFRPPDKKVEKPAEAAQPVEKESEPVQPAELNLPGDGVMESPPRVVQPPESRLFPELYRPPSRIVEEQLNAAQPMEEIKVPEPVQLLESTLPPANTREELPRTVPPPEPEEFPELYQPLVIEELPEAVQPVEEIQEPSPPPGSTVDHPAEPVLTSRPEPEQPAQPAQQLPRPVTREDVKGEAQPAAETPEPPSERRSPLDSLPAWIDVPPVHRPPIPEPPPAPAHTEEVPQPAAPAAQKAEKQPEVKPPVGQSQAPVSAAMPVKTKPFTIEPDVSPELIDLAALVAKPKLPPSPSRPLPPAGRSKAIPPLPERIIRYVLFILVVGIATAVLLFLLPQWNDLWTLLFPVQGCKQTLVLGARTFELRTLKPEADGTLKVPGSHPERAYWVEGTDTNRVFALNTAAENIAFVKSIKDGSEATVTWNNCNTVSFTLNGPLPIVPETSALLDQSTSGITVFLPAGPSTTGYSVWGELEEEKIVTFNTPNPEDVQAEVSLLDVKSEPDGKNIQISISVLNSGKSAFAIASGDLSLTGEDGTSLALINSGPALPKEIQPGATETFNFVFPRPKSDTATLKIIGIEYLIERY